MDYPEYNYIDYAFNGVFNRNNVIDITKLPKYEGKKDCYRTVFRFKRDYLTHFENNDRSVKFFGGLCYCDWMPIDIDAKELNDAYKMAKEVIMVCELDFDLEIKHLFFSGAKGFHILLPIRLFGNVRPSKNLPQVFKNIASDILTVDYDSSIYEINRLFRLNNTINSKTNLYKIPITLQEFNQGIDHVVSLAKNKQQSKTPSFYDCVVNKQLKELYLKYSNNTNTSKKSNSSKIDWDKIKKGVGEGERDVYASKYAGVLRANNVSKEVAFNLLCGWNQGNNPPLEDQEIEKVIDSIYRYEPKSKDFKEHIVPLWAIYDEYKDFVNSAKKVNIGIPEIDMKIRGIRPGQVLTLMGYTGNFKSATLQSILRHYTKYSNEPVIMFELEMTRLDLFERALQMETEASGHEIEQSFIKTDPREVIDIIKHGLPNFYIVDIPYLSFEHIEKYVYLAEQEIFKQKTGLIGIDFVQIMAGQGRSNVERVDYLAKQMKIYAKKLNIPIIILSQVTGVNDPTTPITLNDSRDSKTIEQMSDYVIGVWRGEDENEQILGILKNRKGALGKVSRTINRKTLIFE